MSIEEKLAAKAREELDPERNRSLSKQPATADNMLQWFEYEHLPPHLQAVSAPFCTLAHRVVRDLPWNPERTVALRKLLEAKDAAVRSLIFKNTASGCG